MSQKPNDIEQIITQIYVFAAKQWHTLVTPESLLFNLIFNGKAFHTLNSGGGSIEGLKIDLENYIIEKIPQHEIGTETKTVNPTNEFNQIIKESILIAQSYNRSYATIDDLILSFFKVNSPSFVFLQRNGFKKNLIEDYIFSKNKKQMTNHNVPEDEEENFLINLNEKIGNSNQDPLIGRHEEVNRIIHILGRKKKNNPILIGEPGVGKTSIAEGLAKMIVDKNVEDFLLKSTVWSLDLGGMLAGTKFRGEFEQRLKKVIEKIKKEKNAILFIDEIHTLIGAGSSGEKGSLDAANILKPELANGEIRCIGATTYKEYRNNFEKDSALSRRFQKIEVSEPSKEDTIDILNGLKTHYETFHNVRYHDQTIPYIVDMASKYITDRFFPDKAIDLLDESGSLAKISKKELVDLSIVDQILTKITKLPEKIIIGDQKEILKNLQSNLESEIFGQNEAISKVVDSVLLSKAGIRTVSKPIGSFLFCGPTGVGKTELCVQLSNQLGLEMLRLDMSEYMEKHSVSKLIGTAPGYVGFDQEGILTSFVSKKPHSVILLDEIEKSHPDIWNILLQIMDNGFIMDNFGKKIDFRNTIIIITSNVGSSEINEKSIGLNGKTTISKPTKEIERVFSPEFRNRLSALIWFNSLSKENVSHILEKYMKELELNLLSKNITISMNDSAKQWLISNGYNQSMGARPMKLLIENKISMPLSKEILFGQLSNGGKVLIIEKNNELVFEIGKEKRKKKELVDTN